MNQVESNGYTTLSNGLRVISVRTDGNVTYTGVLVRSGSREDPEGLDGLAHFVEHTIFKGTPRRSGRYVSSRMESVGGELNAYTTKDRIMLHTLAPAGNERRAADLLSELVNDAHFPEQELDLERGVVLEEIHSYADSPGFAVFDEFDEKFFAGTPLAHNILGYSDTVDKLGSKDTRQFLERWFAPGNMVAYMAGPNDPEKQLRIMEHCYKDLQRPMPSHRTFTRWLGPAFDETLDRGNRQANCILGFPTIDCHSEKRFALFLLSNILGGAAMNSRLNMELREKRGLVYTVETSTALYDDTGAFQIYFGCDPESEERCTRLARREISRLAEHRMTDTSFSKATRQLCGQLLVSGDNRENSAMGLAKSLMRHGKVLTARHTARMIESLNPVDLQEAAIQIAESPMSRLVLR